jgi:hypothetical protein
MAYFANILVAGWISITSLFFPRAAQQVIFEGSFAYSESIRLVGALWAAIFILSVAGMAFPEKMQLVLVFQLVYKSIWLLAVALPAMLYAKPYPKAMALFFVVWVMALPFVIQWKRL